MIPGLRVGHWQRIGDGWLTGTTVVLPDAPALAAVDVRGGGPATRDTIALRPGGLRADAIVLTGGSAHGLAAADGVVEWLGGDAPVVPAAAIYDLGRGGVRGNRPDAAAGHAAAATAGPDVAQGCVGAGAGAVTAEMKGGIGAASVALAGGSVVGALAVVNAHGSTLDPATGLPLAAGLGAFGLWVPEPAEHAAAVHALQHPDRPSAGLDLPNTVIGVVATDAPVDHAGLTRAAAAAQRGMARAIRPVHGQTDGDTVFALATGPLGSDPRQAAEVAAAAELAFARAVVHAILAATSVTTGFGHIASYRELYPGATGGAAGG
ncbi:P1 family peptidase [Pseudonocardia sp. CA-107938]|uniref:P1 family peptidase n=1 Tax=Pseudonocardia sp. CA-107938 TaxID=3240021 RepID=UPI003D9080CF